METPNVIILAMVIAASFVAGYGFRALISRPWRREGFW
jgi:hypothetical protein